MTFDQFLDTIIRAGAVAAALGAIGLCLHRLLDRAVVKPITKLVTETVAHELKPNGGSSMRDAVNRIEKAQEEAQTRTLRLHEDNQRAIGDLRADVRSAGIDIPPN